MERITLAPFFVEVDDFVDEINVGVTTSLGLADDFRVVALVFSEEVDVQHFFPFLSLASLSRIRKMKMEAPMMKKKATQQ